MDTDNGLSLCETKDKCRKTKGRAVAVCGFALLRQDNKSTRPWLRQTTRQLVVRQPELWNYGSYAKTTRQLVNETTSGAVAGL